MKLIKSVFRFSINAGYQALTLYRFSHWLWNHNLKIPALYIMRLSRALTSIEIEPAANIAKSVIISHGMGTVIGYDSVVGENVMIRQNVTLGRTGKTNSNSTQRVHPTIENDVSIGAGAVILGNITIGHHAIIGANAVITKDVPPYAVVAGVPGKILRYVDPDA